MVHSSGDLQWPTLHCLELSCPIDIANSLPLSFDGVPMGCKIVCEAELAVNCQSNARRFGKSIKTAIKVRNNW